jgi:hypothetical protein
MNLINDKIVKKCMYLLTINLKLQIYYINNSQHWATHVLAYVFTDKCYTAYYIGNIGTSLYSRTHLLV